MSRQSASMPRTTAAFARGLALAVLALSSYWAVRLAFADHLSRGATLPVREQAVALAPALAPLRERLADLREALGQEPLSDLHRARQLDPENADRLLRLGQRAELTGEFALAERSLREAAARSRLYQPRYALAQFYFRREREAEYWEWARAALEACPAQCAPVWDLCWRLRPEGEWLSREVLPPGRPARSQYLAYLAERERWQAAGRLAQQMAETATAAEAPHLIRYCEAGLVHGQARAPKEVWNTLCRRGLLPGADAHSPPTLLTNGELWHAPSGVGFDWRLTAQPGASVTAEPGRLRVAFNGHQPEACALAWQFVSLLPGTRYRLSYAASAPDTDAVRSIVAEAPGSAGEVASPGVLTFTATQEAGRIRLLYRRPPGAVRIEGAVTIAHLCLEAVP